MSNIFFHFFCILHKSSFFQYNLRKFYKTIKNKKKQRLTKIIFFFFGILFCSCSFLFFTEHSFAERPLENTFEQKSILDPGYKQNLPPVYIEPGEGNTTQEINRLAYDNIIPLFKYLFAFVALLLWIIYIAQMITSAGNEEEISQQRKNMLWGILGFILILLAVELGDMLSPVNNGNEIVNVPEVQREGEKIIGIMQMALGIIALGSVFYAGVNFIRSQGIEEEIEKSKKYFQWGILGLFIAVLAPPLVKNVFYPVEQIGEDPTLTEEHIGNLANEFGGFVSFLLTFLGIGSTATFIIAGFYYITSMDDDERRGKAKHIMIGSATGIILILSAYAITSAFVPQ